jgi:hypothetical protein
MKKLSLRSLGVGAGFLALALTTGAAAPSSADVTPSRATITVYKDPSCGCCKNWVAYLIKRGYRVDVKDTPDMPAIKRSLGVPASVTACHTAVVNGYLIEGHVPAEDIARLLAQKPKVAGLAVPGMPMGSPGMEGPRKDHYQVLAFDKNGKTKVFASY